MGVVTAFLAALFIAAPLLTLIFVVFFIWWCRRKYFRTQSAGSFIQEKERTEDVVVEVRRDPILSDSVEPKPEITTEVDTKFTDTDKFDDEPTPEANGATQSSWKIGHTRVQPL